MKTNENVISSPAEWLGVSCRARREKLEFTLENIETELYILNQLDEFISELTNHVTWITRNNDMRIENDKNAWAEKLYSISTLPRTRSPDVPFAEEL